MRVEVKMDLTKTHSALTRIVRRSLRKRVSASRTEPVHQFVVYRGFSLISWYRTVFSMQ
jgi:hypothetical protein